MNILVTGGLGFIGHNFIKYMFDNFEFNLLINIDKGSYCSNKNFRINDNKYKVDNIKEGVRKCLSKL